MIGPRELLFAAAMVACFASCVCEDDSDLASPFFLLFLACIVGGFLV